MKIEKYTLFLNLKFRYVKGIFMKLNEFLNNHLDDYVYLSKKSGAICDMMVKFLPFWLFIMYGECEIEFQCKSHGRFNVYDVMVKE